MRLRRTELRRRINADLAIRGSNHCLSNYAGLELVRGFLRRVEFAALVRRHASRHLPRSDYGAVSMILLLLALLLSGGRRLRHVGELAGDPIIERFCSLQQLPSARSVSRWLTGFSLEAVESLRRVNEELAARVIRELDQPRMSIDIDGSVISTGLQTEGAKRGYNPHRRKVPSYYPISAYEANSGVMLGVLNRSGNVHDGKAAPAFIQRILDQCARSGARARIREIRMDGAFFRRDVLELLDRERVEYAIKATFHDWLGLKDLIINRKRWKRVEDEVDCFAATVRITPWKRSERITIYRRHVHHKRSKHFQLDLFDPNDGHYEYSAVASNKRLSGRALWQFMNGRGAHEKVYGELKTGFAFATIPTQSYHANSASQVLNLIAFNFNRAMQCAVNEGHRATTQKRRTIIAFKNISTLRRELISRAALVLNASGIATPDIGDNPGTLSRFQFWQKGIANMA